MARALVLAAAALLLCGAACAYTPMPPYATIGDRILGYTYTTDQAVYLDELGQDDCDVWDLLSAGKRTEAFKVYVQGKNALQYGFSWANLTQKVWPGELYNDMIVAVYGPTGINDAIFKGDWSLHWGPLDSGIRSPYTTHMFAAKAKEMLHQYDQSYMETFIIENGNRSVLTGWGTHPWAAHYLDIAFAMWAGNETNACPQATMGYVSNIVGADMGTIYRGMSLQNSAMERNINQAQYWAKNKISSGVWASGFTAASITVELGLQMILRNAYVMDFGKACNAPAVTETGRVSARDVFPFTYALLKGMAKAANGTAALPTIDKLNATVMNDGMFSYDTAATAIQYVLAALPSTFGLEYRRLGGPPTTPSVAPLTPFWWLHSAYPNCTGKPKKLSKLL